MESQTDKLIVNEASPATAAGARGRRYYLGIFLAALAVRLWFNFCTSHANAFDACDAAEYLRYATALSKLNWLTPQLGPEWKEFVITGPPFPLYLWLFSLLVCRGFSADNFIVLITANAVASALAVPFMVALAERFWGRQSSRLTAWLAIIYPAFIVNSGRLYSETFATTVEVIALWLACQAFFGKNRALYYFLLGATLVVLQLTRSSMILLSAAAIVFALCRRTNWKKPWTSLACLAAGSALVLGPWLLFEKAAFNKTSLIVDRVGHYNLFIGTNTTTEGFLSYPYPDGTGIEEKSMLQLAKEAYKHSPSRFIKLALEKPARLYKFPWNDFKTAIGPISIKWQILLHQVLLIFAIFGLCLHFFSFLTQPAFAEEKTITAGRMIILSALLLNLPFLAFITVPRYNLMAMPTLIILAAAGIVAAAHLLARKARSVRFALLSAFFMLVYWRDDWQSLVTGNDSGLIFVQGSDLITRGILGSLATICLFAGLYLAISLLPGKQKLGRLITLALALLLLPLSALAQRANGRPGEGIITMTRAGEKLIGQIPGPTPCSDKNRPMWFLALDCDRGKLLDGSVSISVNGSPITDAPLPGLAAIDNWHYLKYRADGTNYLECSYIFDCLTRPSALTNGDLRQWFYYPLSETLLKAADSKLAVTIENKKDEPVSFFAAAPATKGEATIPTYNLYSWEKAFYGVENDAGLTDPRYDQRVKARRCNWSIAYGNKAESAQGLGQDLDLNCRLIKIESKNLRNESTLSGQGEVTLALNKTPGPTVLSVHIQHRPQDPSWLSSQDQPSLILSWQEKGSRRQMSLPWLKNTETYRVSTLLDLDTINGADFAVTCKSADKNCAITLGAGNLDENPILAGEEP